MNKQQYTYVELGITSDSPKEYYETLTSKGYTIVNGYSYPFAYGTRYTHYDEYTKELLSVVSLGLDVNEVEEVFIQFTEYHPDEIAVNYVPSHSFKLK